MSTPTHEIRLERELERLKADNATQLNMLVKAVTMLSRERRISKAGAILLILSDKTNPGPAVKKSTREAITSAMQKEQAS